MKSFSFSLVFLYLLLSVHSLLAQSALENYHEGIGLLEGEQYQEAMELLRPYMDEQRYGELSPFATFHFSKAALGNRQFELAKTALKQLLEEGTWQKMDEARYLLALVNFEQNKPNEALPIIQNIESEELQMEAYRASFNYLKGVPSSVLMVQYEQFGENLGLLMALREQLVDKTSLSSQEKAVFEKIKDIQLPGKEEEVVQREINETLEVAIVLPFNYNGGSGVKRLESNNFVFELYRGITLALENAKSRNLDLEIKTFDTERNPDRVAGILQDPFFKKADVIIGPIYPEEVEAVSEYAQKWGIPFVNPLSNIGEHLSSTGHSYLFRPSVEAITDNMVKYIRNLGDKNRIAVAYSGTSRDELLAKSFEEKARSMGYQLATVQKVEGRAMRDFFESIGLMESGGSRKADVLVIFSDDPNVASPTFSLVESSSSSIPVVVMDSWLYFNFASYEMMEAQDFHFISNNSLRLGDQEIDRFREDFFDRYKSFPGLNAYLGYELVYLITEVINVQKGFDFRENLKSSDFISGKLTFGFDFTQNSSNNYVPILRLEEGVLVIE
ncbi:ABC transporter substrate-binding protein [Pleomorphovibrio marinus]|uniref:ABC transporter substrate-binding protein n=1 Tax=Pleomorphovibrio marinus TaxID=2164132 RepID=UPI00130032BE|nr:ABC transporter substrate-binding protein [Pleomorphovibrio marinus]